MIVSIRGTNGSGKSTVVRKVMDQAKSQRPVYSRLGPRLPEAYELRLPQVAKPVWVLGPYTVSHQGGCDLFKPYDLIFPMIEGYAARGHVIFEGVLVSSSYGRVGKMLERWGQEAVMLFLTTDLATCIANVEKRRATAGTAAVKSLSLFSDEEGVVVSGREQNPKNLTDKYNSVLRSIDGIVEAGKLRVEKASIYEAPELVMSLLREAK